MLFLAVYISLGYLTPNVSGENFEATSGMHISNPGRAYLANLTFYINKQIVPDSAGHIGEKHDWKSHAEIIKRCQFD